MIKCTANAKINLHLRIVGHDGNLHLLQSYFYPIFSLYDTLHVEIAHKDEVKITPAPYITKFTDSIIAKTMSHMRQAFGYNQSFAVKLQKRIPLGAGLGGGSSNAAAMIGAIDKLLNLNLTHIQKIGVAQNIGADVPFFLQNKPSIVEGFGEIITPIQNPKKYRILLIVPDFSCNTDLIFKTYRGSARPFSPKLKHQQIIDEIGYNDLESAAVADHSAILYIIDALSKCKGSAHAGMSGSGATCYGLFESDELLKEAKLYIKSLFPNCQFWSNI